MRHPPRPPSRAPRPLTALTAPIALALGAAQAG